MLELESKHVVSRFGCAEKALTKSMAHLKASGFRLRKLDQEHFQDTYFDTKDQHLSRAGWSCRVRRFRDEQNSVVTLKRHSDSHSETFSRREITQTLESRHDSEWREHSGVVSVELNALISPDETLKTQFVQKTQRDNYRVTRRDLPDSELCLSMDRINLKKPAFSYAEVEVEHVRGPEAVLQTVHTLLDELPHLISSRMSKNHRALFNLDPIFHAQPTAATQSWRQLALNHTNTQLEQAELYAPFAAEGIHPEGVHQLRIACRQLLAGLQAFDNVLPTPEAAVLQAHTQTLFRSLGPVRDLDVHLVDLEGLEVSRRYRQQQIHERRSAQKALADRLALVGIARMRAAFSELSIVAEAMKSDELSITSGIEQQILPQLPKLRSLGQRAIQHGQPKELHRLRLATKNLNYQLDCIPSAPGSLVHALARLQRVLGRHQDAQIAIRRIEAAESKKKRKEAVQRFERRASKSRKKVKPAWHAFLSALDDNPIVHSPRSVRTNRK